MEGHTVAYGTCLKSIISELGLSAASVSHTLGHKSKTTLHRVLSGDATNKSLQKIHSAFILAYEDLLSANQITRLNTAFSMDSKDSCYHEVKRMFEQIISGSSFEDGQGNADDDAGAIPKEMYQHMHHAKECRILLLNCLDNAPFLLRLQQLIQNNKRRNISVRHYFAIPSDKANSTNVIKSLLPLLFHNNYNGFSLRTGNESAPITLMHSNIAWLSYVDEKNVAHGYQMLWLDQRKGILTATAPEALDSTEASIAQYAIEDHQERPPDCAGSPFDSYLQCLEEYRMAEENRDTYSVHHDLCVSYIDADLQRAAFMDGLRQINIAEDAMLPAINEMYKIQAARFRNTFSKRKVNHLIVSEAGFRKFVRTGKLDNEVEPLRPFTIQERIAILVNLRQQTRNNPYFSIYFYRGSMKDIRVSITCYVDYGVSFVRRSIPYGLAPTDCTCFIRNVPFADMFCRFLRDDIINGDKQILPNSVKFLDGQIEMLKKMLARQAANVTG